MSTDGSRTDAVPGAAGLLTGAVDAGGGLWVLSTPDGMEAYELS